MELTFKWSRLESLTSLEFHEIISVRESVFVVEQQCAYQETDWLDLHSWHLAGRYDGDFAAYLRVIDPGMKYAQPSIGRVMILPDFRGRHLGRALMNEGIRFAERIFAGLGIKISAQSYLIDFYESLGFVRAGESYMDDGILHIDMIKSALSAVETSK